MCSENIIYIRSITFHDDSKNHSVQVTPPKLNDKHEMRREKQGKDWWKEVGVLSL